MAPDTSPVKAPLSSAQRSWAPKAILPPFSTRATSARYTNGGHSSTSAPARSGPCWMASASFTALSRLPFIFQLPATRRWRMRIPLLRNGPIGPKRGALYWRRGRKSNSDGNLDAGGGPHGGGDVLRQGVYRGGLLPFHHHPHHR